MAIMAIGCSRLKKNFTQQRYSWGRFSLQAKAGAVNSPTHKVSTRTSTALLQTALAFARS